ncbi:5-formyltetrahydrofolate cyclo-ligase [Phaeovulum vinaykumarii]|uniref:5-formyltetrahydrofolate cyclo-ligase n=1 Tax=Phaeovulum vinaykumarii TaxID=407234 RepID=A0A1N7JYK4_9RHOB|nr:5-formyltetrahydrofolate cyclo-ligase [Phaeovulum vinaykumarii]SIS54407.1 5-formyltetrahydrofolate cyclo-ligase [Phaeovulum vinaykumarii]SOB91919.1 5-formyltetrahydrofolate cyclo-ligase [Phaeovulum vinaykumarii]
MSAPDLPAAAARAAEADAAKAEARRSARARRAEAARDPHAARALRAELLAALRTLAPTVPGAASGAASGPVAGYLAIHSEADPVPALTDWGGPLCLPVVPGPARPLVFRRWHPDDPLVPGAFGTREPAPEAPEIRPALLVVPLLAFDAAGYRLGYGGGFYDRTLAQLRADGGARPLAVGLAYAAQEHPGVLPLGPHDLPLDLIVTEQGLRRFSPIS